MLDSNQYCTRLWTDFVIKQVIMKLIINKEDNQGVIKLQSVQLLWSYSLHKFAEAHKVIESD